VASLLKRENDMSTMTLDAAATSTVESRAQARRDRELDAAAKSAGRTEPGPPELEAAAAQLHACWATDEAWTEQFGEGLLPR